jgi:hypothetical protein
VPSALHETLIDLFRHHPALAAQFAEQLLGVKLPSFTAISIEDSALNILSPTEFRADLVILLRDDKPVAVIVLEVQLQPDDGKRHVWPVYLTTVARKHRCPAFVLVVTPFADVAGWASEPILLGGDSRIQPLVLGPNAIPHITEPEAVRGREELAVLSAIAHANAPDAPDIFTTALLALRDLDADRARLYLDVIFLHVPQVTRKHLEAIMASGNYEFQSDFAKKYIAVGLEKGREEGLEKGIEKGLEKGLEKGREEGRALAILGVLEARGFAVPEDRRTRVLATRDHAQLDTWLRRAATCATLDEVFAE